MSGVRGQGSGVRGRVAVLVFGLVLAVQIAGAQTDDGRADLLVPVSGERYAAKLAGIDDDWEITFSVEDEQREVSWAEFVSWGRRADDEAGPHIFLADGSLLVAGVVELTSEHMLVKSLGKPFTWADTRLPLESVRGVVFRPSAVPLDRDLFAAQMLAADGAQDRIWLENGDELRGILVGTQTGAEGTGQTYRLETEAREAPIKVPATSVRAILFDPALVEVPKQKPMRMLMGFRDGSCLHVEHLQVDGQQLALTLAGNITLKTDPYVDAWQQIALLRPLGDHVTYLSDLTPLGYKHVPFLELPWSYGVDKNALGGLLRSGGSVFTKGLGMHSTSRLAYELGGRYREFHADLAIDEVAGLHGSVEFRVFLQDGGGAWMEAYQSPVVRGGNPPLPLTVDVSGATRMALIVGFADRGDVLDHADWLGARLVP